MTVLLRAGIVACALLLIGGCATRPVEPIALNGSAQSGRIGVAMTTVPKADTRLPGADCLLCMAAASIANSSLISHSRTLSAEDLAKLKEEIAERLRRKGAEAIVIDEPLDVSSLERNSSNTPNAPAKDFRPLRSKYPVDKLLLIELDAIGMERQYQAYIPAGPPKAVVRGAGSMIDLRENTYLWFQPLAVLKGADGAWDEPPKYPGLTNAYYQAIELAKDALIEPFGR